MGLIAFIGDLGVGKTLSLTYWAFRNYRKGMHIFSNYDLAFPHTRVRNVGGIEKMENGFFAGDELWLWLDSRQSLKSRSRVVTSILAKSRKRGIDIGFTTQSFRQIDVRIRNITDFVAVPSLRDGRTASGARVENAYCELKIFDRHEMRQAQETHRFLTAPFFKMFNTREEVKLLPRG